MSTSPTPGLRWTFSTLGCAEASLPQAAALAKRFDFSGLEVRAMLGRIDLPQVLADEYGGPEGLAEVARGLEVPLVALDSSLRLLKGSEEHRQETVALLRWADAVGVPYVRVFDGGETGQARDAAVRKELSWELNWWRDFREKEGIRCQLMVETHWALTNPDDILRLADDHGAPFPLLWDVAHTWTHTGQAPAENWARLRPLVCHVHVKDAVMDPTAKGGVRHTLPGAGALAIPEFLQLLREDGFEGPVSLEWERYWEPGMPPLEMALESGRGAGWW